MSSVLKKINKPEKNRNFKRESMNIVIQKELYYYPLCYGFRVIDLLLVFYFKACEIFPKDIDILNRDFPIICLKKLYFIFKKIVKTLKNCMKRTHFIY
jgi:hypothetical protein